MRIGFHRGSRDTPLINIIDIDLHLAPCPVAAHDHKWRSAASVR
jgi:hypothetical protein